MNLFEAIFNFLKLSKIRVATPGTIVGEIQNDTVVVKLDEETKFRQSSSNQMFVDILCYIPKNNYHRIDEFAREVRDVLKKCYFLKYADQKTAPYFDETYGAWMVSMLYYIVRKN